MVITREEIREARKRAGMTQETLAEASGFSARQIMRFEADDSLVRLNKYFNLFKTLSFEDDEKEKE